MDGEGSDSEGSEGSDAGGGDAGNDGGGWGGEGRGAEGRGSVGNDGGSGDVADGSPAGPDQSAAETGRLGRQEAAAAEAAADGENQSAAETARLAKFNQAVADHQPALGGIGASPASTGLSGLSSFFSGLSKWAGIGLGLASPSPLAKVNAIGQLGTAVSGLNFGGFGPSTGGPGDSGRQGGDRGGNFEGPPNFYAAAAPGATSRGAYVAPSYFGQPAQPAKRAMVAQVGAMPKGSGVPLVAVGAIILGLAAIS